MIRKGPFNIYQGGRRFEKECFFVKNIRGEFYNSDNFQRGVIAIL